MSLDIFSKSTPKEENKPRIIVDFRERNSLVPAFLIKNNCLIEFKKLHVGDYLSGETVIERKTFSDLQSSILDKRAFQQISSLEKANNKLIIIEGEKDNLRLHPNAIRGFILFSVKNSLVPIIFSKNEEETANYIRLLSNTTTTPKMSLRPNIKFKTKEDRVKHILEGFPSIGPTTSNRLIEKFKSIKNIINASESDLKEILKTKTFSFIDLVN